MAKKGYLHLEDGTTLEGELRGAVNKKTGEVVFSTGMVGYGEAMTDPSFAGQILTFTYPIIGNYGIPEPKKIASHLMENFESERIWVEGVICATLTDFPSHHESDMSFEAWCKKWGIPILVGIDTRELTKKLREHGVMRGIITADATISKWNKKDTYNYQQVSIKEVVSYASKKPNGKHIALIDCGVKHGIIRSLLTAGYKITRVPWNLNPLDISKKFDGVLCSNGPGDPKDWLPTVENIRKILAAHVPFIGVCLGHQLLSLAIGADTYKLKYGHRGINQPCQDLETKRCYLTSQNHGYAVKSDTIPKTFTEWMVNLNDGTNEGIKNERQKIWTIQFHPEGNPGPFDTEFIFGKF